MGRKQRDLTGERFGRLVVIELVGKTHYGQSAYKCKCDCGNETVSAYSNLTSGNTSSCGCKQKEQMVINGGKVSGSIQVKNWVKEDCKEGTRISMLGRKANKNSKSGVTGVSWDANKQLWMAQLNLKGKVMLRKRFSNKQDAINARKEAEEKYFKPILEKYSESEESK